MSGWADPKADVLSIVHAWLSDENNGRWTIVVDNADSHEVMFGLRSREAMTTFAPLTAPITTTLSGCPLSDYLPSAAHGSIVITTCSREVAEGLIEYTEDILDLSPMKKEDAIALLTNKLQRPQRDIDREELTRFVQELDYMPLAITNHSLTGSGRLCKILVILFFSDTCSA